MSGEGKPFDLEERTSAFGEAIIDFAKTIPVTPITTRLIAQLVGAATSVGANYCEADDAVSKKDFRHKISISKQEARNQILHKDDSKSSARIKRTSKTFVARSQGTPSDFR